jgi:hypothetical protein
LNKRKKVGVLLCLSGIGIPIVIYFFQVDEVIYTIKIHKVIERKLSKDEINSLYEISRLKKELETLMPDYMDQITTKIAEKDWWWEKLPKEGKEAAPKPDLSFEEFLQLAVTYESKLIGAIKAAYAVNNFEKEAWNVDSIKMLEIPYRQIVGVGVLFVFIGMGFIIFSFFKKQKTT